MRHEEFQERLHDLVDGELSESERLDLEAHAQACSECAGALESLREIVGAAQALPRSIEPPRDLWPEIGAAIGAGTPVRSTAQGSAERWRRWFAGPRPALQRWAAAGAFALLAVAALSLLREAGEGRRAISARTAASPAELFPALLTGLELQCRAAGQLLQASLQLPVGPRSLEAAASGADGLVAGLSILDRSIDDTQTALAADPGNPELQRLLAVRYQQKLALLNAALLRAETT